jgi:hypothetical protein
MTLSMLVGEGTSGSRDIAQTNKCVPRFQLRISHVSMFAKIFFESKMQLQIEYF